MSDKKVPESARHKYKKYSTTTDRETWELASLLIQARTTAATSLETYSFFDLSDHERSGQLKSQTSGKPDTGDSMVPVDIETAHAIDELIRKQRQAIETLETARELYPSNEDEPRS